MSKEFEFKKWSPSLHEINQVRISRRAALKGIAGAAAAGLIPAASAKARQSSPGAASNPEGFISTLTFPELERKVDADHHVAKGYRADVVVRWGDTIQGKPRPFDPANLDVRDQSHQFGYNCDFIAFFPLPQGSDQTEDTNHGLLCVNHEYTNPYLMWSGLTHQDRLNLSKIQCDYEMTAHGHSVVEVKKLNGKWTVAQDYGLSRRISVFTPQIQVSGPAGGHRRLRTGGDPTGMIVNGTLNNCAGGVTPWGTILIAEENFNKYFTGDLAKTGESQNFRRYNILPEYREYCWWKYYDQFNFDIEPHEPNRFGWMVEFDPYEPEVPLVKRTALGRLKHEGATVALNHDGRIVVYTGDDEANEYMYRYVSKNTYVPGDIGRNRLLLDEGVLYVGKFEADGTMRWLPLVWNNGPLNNDNGFVDQGDVLIETRRSADLMGATPLDRTEEVEVSPVTGRVYAMLTENAGRTPERVDAVNPRAHNKYGHVVELIPPGAGAGKVDHTAETYEWNIFLKAGDPFDSAQGAEYNAGVTKNGWIACPDNAVFDRKGRLWICTDHGTTDGDTTNPDGIWATDTVGGGKALTRMFYAGPIGSELTGPCFTPDNRTLFASVQHPGETHHSTFDSPSTRWPDFKDGMPPRPSVVAIQKEDGGEFGS
ncbi:MAG TPA: PhoX family phosphatase [Phycisphaerales bacterium]|nr:PhoX family phosphatase [Phycisphaerales bacterium]